jgi:hypothetical protein
VPGPKAACRGGRGAAAAGLANSLQQEQLRESIEKLDERLAAIRQQLPGRLSWLAGCLAGVGKAAF